jgi:S1-C subfamily serine protease
MIESLLLAVVHVATVKDGAELTNATGFFFERDERLYLVTARHVVRDEASDHAPDSLLVDLHSNPDNVVEITRLLVPLYDHGQPLWRGGVDAGGEVDVAVVELDRGLLPPTLLLRAFTPAHVVRQFEDIEVGSPIVIVGFPLGFQDTLHHLPVARQGIISTSFGIRFQGTGCFLTDARMHRGASGAPVVARSDFSQSGREDLPWRLLGIHASRMDVSNRDVVEDSRLNLNTAWYADILLALTE